MRVLYVEDNEVNQALVARVMRAKQCEVVFREEGEGALEVLAEDEDIDLVLLDIELAGIMSGLDVVRTLRERNDQRPVVAITAYAMMGDRERILEAGCDQYLPKPLVIPDLLNLLDEYKQEFDRQADAPAAAQQPAAPAAVDSAPADAAPKPAASTATPAGAASEPASAPAATPSATQQAETQQAAPDDASGPASESAAQPDAPARSGTNGTGGAVKPSDDAAQTVDDTTAPVAKQPAAAQQSVPVASGSDGAVEDRQHG